jgi:ring-1,2-phenylacetyl-CoA epoxidase subunit PaaC
MTKKEALFNYLLQLGDNALIQGHRLSEWCSKAPFLEEDLALTNMALDNIGRAQSFLKYAGFTLFSTTHHFYNSLKIPKNN